jgi:pescadillo protein
MFRRLCILKGIYPREPKNRKKAQQGATDKKTLYLKKDIQFLLREPIVWKLREHKIYLRKKSRARAIGDADELSRIMQNKPMYSLDHIVKERYPTFIDALRDLDDCLTLCFLFSTFPSIRFVPAAISSLCRRLTVEFLHYVIEARALRKVFVSTKGYYYQADLNGQVVTWIVPHYYGFQPQSPDAVDFRIMATFVDFYCTLLGFINFRLYHSLNLCYPPKLTPFSMGVKTETSEDMSAEHVAALNRTLLKVTGGTSVVGDHSDFESLPPIACGDGLEELKKEADMIEQAKEMFQNFKFFLNREVPKESLTFIIRAFGGQVSWDKTLFIGATYGKVSF